jgi:hypothetical protein
MSAREKESKYREAQRYLKNAKEILKGKANKKDNYYEDTKYVRMACGTAYSGTLLAIDTLLEIKGKPIKKRSRVSIEDYRKQLTTVDKKLLKTLQYCLSGATSFWLLRWRNQFECDQRRD